MKRPQHLALLTLSNGLVIGLGLVIVFLLPGHDIPKWVVIILCIWNYLLGRMAERVFRDDGV